ncbi:MAG: glycerophosphodiester phosphodiesterase family protein [Pirellulaceae bacterium]
MGLISLSIGAVMFVSAVDAQDQFAASVFRACKNGTVLVAAHRGGYADDKSAQAPENSIANLQLAIKKGFDVYETDIQRTADGVFVIVHDATVDRELNGSGAASDMMLAQLKSLFKRFRDGTISDQRVATLEELLVAGKDRILFKPDLKPGIIDRFDELARLINRLGMNEQVFLRTEFRNAAQIKKCFEQGTPRVEVMFKTKNVSQVQSIIDQFHPLTIQVDLANGESISNEKKMAIQQATKAGVLVETHIYSDTDQWKQLVELGVRMFHTTKPDAALVYLKNSGRRVGLPFGKQ